MASVVMHSAAWLVVIPELEQRMKKHMSLKEAMASIKIEECPNGYRVFTPAGWAEYDAWGYRTVVSGIPEFLPEFIRLRKDDKPVKDDFSERVGDSVDGIISNAVRNSADQEAKVQTDGIIPLVRNPDGSLGFNVVGGQTYINEAYINKGGIHGWKISRAIQEDKQTREGKEAATHTAAVRISVETPESEDEKLTSRIREVIRQEKQKGGMLWRW